jgi:D-arabinose 5-phosphate isomerase GutQ
MIVAFGSGRSRLVGRSDAAAFKSIDVARIVAFGSNVCGAISKPPSNVQNF